jgi:demethylmenaquinone methyltransferase/2-methoxy-6-polyprenyl-1,4-benzoquinol methylase
MRAKAKAGSGLRPSGYASRIYELWYGLDSPLYDLVVWWGFLPLGGEAACREEFVRWFEIEPGQRVASLCCGTGGTERAILRMVPDVTITGIDLGPGQLARARRKNPGGRVDYRLADASRTGLPPGSFDRVLITFALHEMPRALRAAVLTEAARICAARGRVIAIEHGSPRPGWSALFRALWWFFWLPGNPEVATSRDLQRRGLAREMEEAGMIVIDRRVTDPAWVEGVIARLR